MITKFLAAGSLAVLLSGCAGSVSLPGLIAANASASASTSSTDPLTALANYTTADLAAADADAVAHGDDVAHACYPALTTFVASLPTSTPGTTVAGAFSLFQKERDLRNVVAAGIPKYLLMGCAPLVTEVRGDFLSLLPGVPAVR